MLRILGGFVLLMALAAGPVVGQQDGQQDVLRWRVNSLLYPKLFGEAGERFAETVRLISGGSFVIEINVSATSGASCGIRGVCGDFSPDVRGGQLGGLERS